MRINEAPLLPMSADAALKIALTKTLRETATKVNQVAGGAIAGFDNTSLVAPSTGTWFQGDYVKKSNPVVAGAAASQYVIKGWTRITSGSGNVLNTDWAEDRALTGT